ncbi:hypothetical protein [Janthinobacterium sp. NKUCC06_STL]|uniref:hypothetical protein n=1 Tax=Janthinobacterium sp. NKUCC06_STL TaxID=2842127 RepID=UPI001C5B813F|nr:hypothetical protein [Janthinobacterium sp. NKUCC06_STL]MBW3511546.1 hypothetical protein [Janthinobacterium sp. NKUCC06_STL]
MAISSSSVGDATTGGALATGAVLQALRAKAQAITASVRNETERVMLSIPSKKKTVWGTEKLLFIVANYLFFGA